MYSVVVVKGEDWKTIKQREDRKRNWRKVGGAGATTATLGTGVYGLSHHLQGRTFDDYTLQTAKFTGKRFPYVRAAAKTPKGKLKLAGLGLGLAGVGTMAAGGLGTMHEQRKINQRRKANQARSTERAAHHERLRSQGVVRDGHIFTERLGPDGEIMQTHSGYKQGQGGKLVKVGKAAPMTPVQRDQKKLHQVQTKQKQSDFGLANNLFGAAAGAYGTKAVYDQARAKQYPKEMKAQAAAKKRLVASRATAQQRYRVAIGKKPTTALARGVGRLHKITAKVPKKIAAPLAIGTAAATQLVNAGMDAQSGAYFAGESARLRGQQRGLKKKIEAREGVAAKSYERTFDLVRLDDPGSGIAKSLTVDVSKRVRRFDPEADRQRRLGMYQGLGYAGAAGGTGAAGVAGWKAYQHGKGVADTLTKVQRTALKGAGKRAAIPLALLAGAGGSAALGVAAQRRGTSARNQRWT